MPSTHDLRPVPAGGSYEGVPLADFSPTPNEPDLNVWPLANDKGAESFSGDPCDLIPIYNTLPEPHVRWLTHEQFRYEFSYSHNNRAEFLTEEDLEYISDRRRLTLSETRMEAFDRLARLWNGKSVGPNGVHLLADKVPGWGAVFGDLDQQQLERLRPITNRLDEELISEFGDYAWFEPEHTIPRWVKSTYIARSRADYDIEERTRTLINGRDDLPNLRGDPHEGLKHRFGVGVEAMRAEFCEHREVETYVDVGDYTVDLLEDGPDRGKIVGEVLTHHHNNQLYRDTYRKIAAIGCPAVIVFDDRSTARRVLNHWHDRGVKVPGGRFESEMNLEWTRGKFGEAAANNSRDWVIEDIFTVSQLWNIVFDESPAPTPWFLSSVDW